MGEKKKMDAEDFKILEYLLDNGRIKQKDLAELVNLDERMVSRRIERLQKEGIIKRFTIDIDWSKLGYDMHAYVTTNTAIGNDMRNDLYSFFNTNHRIIRADSTVGASEYVLFTICKDIHDFRTKISIPLEPLTAGISTSIISSNIKQRNCKALLKIIAEEYAVER